MREQTLVPMYARTWGSRIEVISAWFSDFFAAGGPLGGGCFVAAAPPPAGAFLLSGGFGLAGIFPALVAFCLQ